MLIEFQTTGTNFLYLFREKLKTTPMPLIDERTDEQGRTLIVNRVVVGNDTQLRFEKPAGFNVVVPLSFAPVTVTGKRMQIVQPITVEFVYLDDLIKSGDLPSPVTPLQIWVVFDVSLQPAGGAVNLMIAYSEVTGFLPPDALAAIDAQLRNAIQPQSKPVDLDDLQEMIGGLGVLNAGIACRPGNYLGAPGSISMRIEFGSPSTSQFDWQGFYDGAYSDLLATQGKRSGAPLSAPAERWAVFISKDILERFLKKTLNDSFSKGGDLKLRSDIDVHWSNPDNQARLDASFKALAANACDLEPFGKYDIRLDVQIPLLLSVPADGTLREDLKINYWKNDIDTAACVVGVGVLWPIIGVQMMSDNNLKWWQYELLLVLVPFRFIAAVMEANKTKLDPPDAKFTKISDDEFRSDQPFTKKKPGDDGYLELLDYRGLSTGLVLTGRQLPLPDRCPAFIDADHCDFDFKAPQISCSSVAQSSEDELRHSVTRGVYGAGNCSVENTGEAGCPGLPKKVPLQQWGYRFLDDALAKNLKVLVTEDFYTEAIAITLRCPIPPADYFADPQPLRFLLKTNGGARVFSYPPLKKLSQEEINRLSMIGAVEAVSRCEQLVAPWWRHYHGFNPKWHVDPPAFRSPDEQRLWVMAFVGAQPDDRFGARIGDRTLQEVRANSRGEAVLAVKSAEQSSEELSLYFEPGRSERRDLPGRMLMSQTALSTVGECVLSAPVRAMQVTRQNGMRRLHALHDDGYSVIDVSVPAASSILSERRSEHLRGASFDDEGLILFQGGRAVRGDALRGVPPAHRCSERGAIRTLWTGDRYYAVRHQSLEIYDAALCHRQSLPLRQIALDAVLIDDRLVIAGGEGLTTLDTSRGEPVFAHFDVGHVESVHAPDFGAAPGGVLIGRRGRYELFELPLSDVRARKLAALAEYDRLPWYAGAVLFDSIVVTADASKISLYSIVSRMHRCPSLR